MCRKEHLYLLEKEEAKEIYYVLYSDQSGKWRVQAVAKSTDSFESRKALPENWRGVRDSSLSELSGIPGCVFVHATGFIGGNETEAGALAMAVAGVLE
jgi:urease accessory protein